MQYHCLSEWPDVSKALPYQCEEEGEVSALSTSISVHVQPQAHLVSMATGVEWSKVERRCSS